MSNFKNITLITTLATIMTAGLWAQDITDGCDLPGGMLYLSDANGSSVLYNSPAHSAFCIDPTYTNNSTNFLDQMGF